MSLEASVVTGLDFLTFETIDAASLTPACFTLAVGPFSLSIQLGILDQV